MMTQKPDTDLSAFFDSAKDIETVPNAAFMEAVMADALHQTQSRVKPAPAPEPWWQTVLDSFGGWKGIGALTACACFGIYLGYASPENLSYINGIEITTDIIDEDSFSIAYDIEALFQEG